MNSPVMNQTLIQAVKSLNRDKAHMHSKLVEANYPQAFIHEVINLYKPLGREGMFDDSLRGKNEPTSMMNNSNADQVELYRDIKNKHYKAMAKA